MSLKYVRTIWYVEVGSAGKDKIKSIVEEFKAAVEEQITPENSFGGERIQEQRLYVAVRNQATHCVTTIVDT